MHSPTTVHFQATLRVLRYLRGTASQGILLTSHPQTQLATFYDSDWAGCPNTRHSTSSFCILLGNSLISWKSKRETVVPHNTIEAKYRAMALTICEVM